VATVVQNDLTASRGKVSLAEVKVVDPVVLNFVELFFGAGKRCGLKASRPAGLISNLRSAIGAFAFVGPEAA
jgi:hypothetical protein